VARILCDLHMDEEAICAALLHDTVEDTEATLEELAEIFNGEIAELVDGVTKLSKIRFRSTEEHQAENFRKMLLAMSKDIRVILVKLADRTHNMRTLRHLPPAKQKVIARETMDIYAPLANRLGLGGLKAELEDLSFRYTEPEAFETLRNQVNTRVDERKDYIKRVVADLHELMAVESIEADITGRPKHFTSIHRKMVNQGIPFEMVHDLIAFRIIVGRNQDCYHVLGLIHDHWRPVPGRFKDYIALPKANKYQSLHTTVIGPDGHPVEIQIRTHEMHQIAEGGMAAHWRYKEADAEISSPDEERFEWLKRMMEWQKELDDPSEFLESVKMELFAEDVYTFTPSGDLKVLIRGSTPVDFAYSIHSEVGNTCSGAMVNGSIVPLSYQLRNGDVVEIITNRTQKPSKHWLRFVKSNRAVSRIRAFIKKEQRVRSIELGEQLLDKELRRYSRSLARVRKTPVFEEAAKALNLDGGEEILVQLGSGKLTPSSVIRALLPPEETTEPKPAESTPKGTFARFIRRVTGGPGGVVVDGLDGVKHTIAKCCSPVPGESIIGFVTPGHVVSVHRTGCANILDLPPEREVDVTWGDSSSGYPVTLKVVTDSGTPGLLSKMTKIFADLSVNIDVANSHDKGEGSAASFFTFHAKNVDELNSLIRRLRSIRGIHTVERIRSSSE
ncbi:MAG: bifunctional (p)ppGpp synthetase/guanosine-3',5'-bis(diphosphate) 3'-pyrophosphohydrolase, partial [Myxococcota bacterium]|nr:bifunctional (p)ppGpp synthetase/guanosine-3',5'-bis(diphosphate) 3'-pyrophosphohydrolase [Myxococcota bacterium]